MDRIITVRGKDYSMDDSCLQDLKVEYGMDIGYGAVEDMDFTTWLDRYIGPEMLELKYGAREAETYPVCDLSLMDRLEALAREHHPDWDLRRSDLFHPGQMLALYHKGKAFCDVVCTHQSKGGLQGNLEYWDCSGDAPVGDIADAEAALSLFENGGARLAGLC